MEMEFYKTRTINHYEIKKGQYKITIVCDGGSSHGLWGVSFKVLTGKGHEQFVFKNPGVTRAVGELLIKAAEIMEREPSD